MSEEVPKLPPQRSGTGAAVAHPPPWEAEAVTPRSKEVLSAQAQLHSLSLTSWSQLFFSTASLEGEFKLSLLFC